MAKKVFFKGEKFVFSRVKGNAETDYREGDINITPSNLGLDSVNNTSDKDKPVSIAQQKAIDVAYANSNKYTDQKIANLINGAPETMDTLKEVSDAITASKTTEEALNKAIGTKANQSELDMHTGNDTIHITASEREKWNKNGGVTGVRGSEETEYKTGQVTISKDNIGLGNVDNTKDSNKDVNSSVMAQGVYSSVGVKNSLQMDIHPYTPFELSNITQDNSSNMNNFISFDGENTKFNASYNTANLLTTFVSGDSSTGDSTAPAVITSGETHKSLFNKISTAVKNVRWLLSKMGTTDISAIGNGTVTGALSTLDSNKQDSDTAITTSNIGSQTVYQATHIGNCEVQNVASGNKNYYLGADGGTNPIQWIPRNSMAVGYANNAGAVNGYAINYIEGKGTLGSSTHVAKGNAYYIRFGNVVILYCYDLIITPGTNNNSVIVSNLPASAKYFGVQRTNSGNQTLRFGMDSDGKELKVWWDSFSTVDGTNSKSWSFEIVYLCK